MSAMNQLHLTLRSAGLRLLAPLLGDGVGIGIPQPMPLKRFLLEILGCRETYIQNELQTIRDTNQIWVVGGRPRRIRVELDPVRLAAHRTSALQVAQALLPCTIPIELVDVGNQLG